ncbi:MAG: PD-(D/E)XK nuclease family protein [Crocinitomicaceae bacterium]|nr:PD-(D/E)XK nuclease family protein [Crocinitomicaceae bacterium]
MYFTDEIALYIEENNLDLKHLTLVLPSERAKKYIARSLYNRAQQPLLAPEMITIDQWVKGLSPVTVIDKTRALIRLFSIQLEKLVDPKDASFDEFIAWGNTLLNDFDEIDRYLLSSEQVFKNLADIKEIEAWSFDSVDLTEGQKRFMEFWDRLPDYYTRLNKKLSDENVCYMGKAYRFVAENIDCVFQKDKQRHFLFAGFNALSKSELKIIKQLHVMGRGHVLINADTYYFNDINHEAGKFLRELKATLQVKELPFVQNTLTTAEKSIKIIECAQQTGQVKIAATLLNKLDEETLNNTLVLLADESLIAPLLKNLPQKIGKANVTLGLPLKNTAIRTWVDLLFTIQENKSRFKTEAIYIHDLQKFWNHPFVKCVLSEAERETITQIEQKFIQQNRIFLALKTIKIGGISDQLLALFNLNWQADWNIAIQTIRQINGIIYSDLKQEDGFEKAVVQGFDHALVDFENIVQEGLPAMSMKSFRQLFQQHWSSKSIAYHGNPLEGLQIMGLLETRLLDFKNCIVLGLNEGKMPPTNPIQTMIPMDLRKYLGLPSPREKQGLFAHHFYRLLHHCETMYITYTSAQESIGSNEASRYVLQLELELARLNPKCKIEREFYTIPSLSNDNELHQIVEKTPTILERMDVFFERAISASAINTYLKCPLNYYYKYLLDFGEEKTIEEEVENNTFGSFIHNVLELLFEPFARHDKKGVLKPEQPSNLTALDVERMLQSYEELIRSQFMLHFNDDVKAFETGKNLLSYKMALELTKRILEKEKGFVAQQKEPVFIEFIEATLEVPLEITVYGKPKTIRLKGVIDRVDSIGNKIRIIDYKSGKSKEEDVKFPNKTESGLIQAFSSKKHLVQLTWYSYLYQQQFGVLPDEATIYSMVNIAESPLILNSKDKSLQDIVALFPQFIEEVFADLYAVEKPFEHLGNDFFGSYCAYCE